MRILIIIFCLFCFAGCKSDHQKALEKAGKRHQIELAKSKAETARLQKLSRGKR